MSKSYRNSVRVHGRILKEEKEIENYEIIITKEVFISAGGKHAFVWG